MRIEFTNEVAFGEPPPSVIVSCTLREVRELSSRLLHQDKLDLSSEFEAKFSAGISGFQIAISEGDEHLVKVEDGKASISLSRENARTISEMLNGVDSAGQTIYVDLDGLDLFEEANLIIYTI
ncbi:hypothetical protein [Mesorhizobium sp. WSM3860]|uniref:hypothetical protein n=1 Tax=Mesorhizobium sp. WSM3860 TaxID=2029403 RepID=UPI000BB01563|nr:hypothetical protein [Mesorhizobium sp. WSM3860]PBC02721.1 hypothetical protein CK220_19875 [Mesorhizobium sp. WSM3860]